MQKFANWQRSREAVPTIVALRQRFEAIRKAELERLEPKLAALPPEARARVDEITRLMVEKLLLQPTEQLKNAGDAHLVSQYAEALTRLFATRRQRIERILSCRVQIGTRWQSRWRSWQAQHRRAA